MQFNFYKRLSLLLLAVLLVFPPASWSVTVRVETVIGGFDILMREDDAPNTVVNFLNYVRRRDFDNSFFHRSVPGFVVQGGGFTFSDGEFGDIVTDPPVVNEFSLSNLNLRSTVAMAKLGGDPDSATKQWFVNLTDNDSLDDQNGGFTVFGEVVTSMAVPDAIGTVPEAVPGETINIIDARFVDPLSETSFVNALLEFPALNFDLDSGADFDPESNMVLVTSMREIGVDMFPAEPILDFIAVDIGTSKELVATLTSRGLGGLSLIVDPAGPDNPAFTVTSNTCTEFLPTDASCVVTVSFAPLDAGLIEGSLGISSNDTDAPDAQIQLRGEGLVESEARIVTLPEVGLAIGPVAVGETGNEDITVSNEGTAVLSVSSIVFNGDGAAVFSQTNNCSSVAVGADCTITVVYAPVTTSLVLADLVIASNDPAMPEVTIQLAGAAEPESEISVGFSELNFGEIPVNGFSELLDSLVSVTNQGVGNLAFESITLGGENVEDFSLSHGCGIGLSSGAICLIDARFRPTSEGPKTAMVIIKSNDRDEPESIILLNGVGKGFKEPDPDILVGPAEVMFAEVSVGESLTEEITVSNRFGTIDLVIESVAITGVDVANFSQTNDCSLITPDGETCTIIVTFLPRTSGDSTATLTILSNDVDQPVLTVPLTGTGLAVDEPAIALQETVVFGDVAIGTFAQELVRLSNEGLQDLEISSIQLSGADVSSFAESNDCPSIVAPSAFCTITIAFNPDIFGESTATLTVISNDPVNGTSVVAISGTSTVDSDGVVAEIEDAHPSKNMDGRGDGNGDGIADALQSNVASLPNINGEYVTIESPTGTRLVDVLAIDNPLPSLTPTRSIVVGTASFDAGASISFDEGFYSFSVRDVSEPIEVRLIFDKKIKVTTYFKISPTPDNPVDHWYDFGFNGVLGAEIKANEIVLHFTDGELGDGDLTVNGVIQDPGGPAFIGAIKTEKSSSGCTASSGGSVNNIGSWWLLYVLLVCLAVFRRQRMGGCPVR